MTERIMMDARTSVERQYQQLDTDQMTIGKVVPIAVLEGDQRVEVLEEVVSAAERLKPHPNRKKATVSVNTPAAFAAYVNRHKDASATVVWGDSSKSSFLGVLDDHAPASKDPGWREHTVHYTCPLSPEWVLWTKRSGDPMTQQEFSDFLEDNMEHLVDGKGLAAPVEMLEVARNLQVFTKGTYTKQLNRETGEYSLIAKTEHSQDSTKIPRAFGLALRVYEGGDAYRVEARVRFAMRNGVPQFTYVLHRERETVRDAFDGLVATISKETKVPVFDGWPW